MKILSVWDFSLISAATLPPPPPNTLRGRRAGGSEQPEGNFLTRYRLAAFVGPQMKGLWHLAHGNLRESQPTYQTEVSLSDAWGLVLQFSHQTFSDLSVDGFICSYGHTVCTQAEDEVENEQSRGWRKDESLCFFFLVCFCHMKL